MLALRSNLKNNPLPVVRDDVFNQPLLKPLLYKSIVPAHERKITGRKTPRTRNQFSSMGLIIPFQPSMWDDKTIDANWNDAMQMVQAKMKGKYTEVCTAKMLARLKKLFPSLNFNTHRKSLALIITPVEEKLFYLDFPVKLVVFFNKQVSILELTADKLEEADFYYLVLHKSSASLYDYSKNKLRKVSEHKQEPHINSLMQKAFCTTELLNSKNEKPVFITGSPNLVELFYNNHDVGGKYFPLLYHIAPYSDVVIQEIIEEITGDWNYWRSKFITTNILLAQKTNRLISHTEAVLQALRRGADGLLLMDKRLKHQFQKPTYENVIFQMSDELISLIENFLARGNRFEITETGLLKDFGGIVLLQSNRTGSTELKLNVRHTSTGGSLF